MLILYNQLFYSESIDFVSIRSLSLSSQWYIRHDFFQKKNNLSEFLFIPFIVCNLKRQLGEYCHKSVLNNISVAITKLT